MWRTCFSKVSKVVVQIRVAIVVFLPAAVTEFYHDHGRLCQENFVGNFWVLVLVSVSVLILPSTGWGVLVFRVCFFYDSCPWWKKKARREAEMTVVVMRVVVNDWKRFFDVVLALFFYRVRTG